MRLRLITEGRCNLPAAFSYTDYAKHPGYPYRYYSRASTVSILCVAVCDHGCKMLAANTIVRDDIHGARSARRDQGNFSRRSSDAFRCPQCMGRLILAGDSVVGRYAYSLRAMCLTCDLAVHWCGIRSERVQDN
jgi:hypothetical protein